MDEITRALGSLSQKVEQIADDTSELRHVLLTGNGTPALTTTVARLDERVKSLEVKDLEQRVPRHVTLGLVVSILLGVAGLLIAWKGN